MEWGQSFGTMRQVPMTVDLKKAVPEPASESAHGNAAAPPRRIWWTFAGAAAILTIMAVSYLPGLNTAGPYGLKVYGSFWASGWAARQHLNPYGTYPLTWVFPFQSHTVVDLNLSPPAMLPLFEGLTLLAPNVGVKVWTLLSLLLFVGSAALLTREYEGHIQHRQILWLVLGRATLNTLWLGQDYSLFVALAVATWVLLERNRELPAGVALGVLIAFKPNYVLWVVLLALIGRWRSSAMAVAVGGALSALPLVLYGRGIYGEWMRAVRSDPHWFFPNEVSISGFARHLGIPLAGTILSVLLVLAACAVVLWKRPSLRDSSGLALSVGMLASPIAWFHYALLMAGPLFRERWGIGLTVALAFLVLPWGSVFYFVPLCCVMGYFFWRCGETALRG